MEHAYRLGEINNEKTEAVLPKGKSDSNEKASGIAKVLHFDELALETIGTERVYGSYEDIRAAA